MPGFFPKQGSASCDHIVHLQLEAVQTTPRATSPPRAIWSSRVGPYIEYPDEEPERGEFSFTLGDEPTQPGLESEITENMPGFLDVAPPPSPPPPVRREWPTNPELKWNADRGRFVRYYYTAEELEKLMSKGKEKEKEEEEKITHVLGQGDKSNQRDEARYIGSNAGSPLPPDRIDLLISPKKIAKWPVVTKPLSKYFNVFPVYCPVSCEFMYFDFDSDLLKLKSKTKEVQVRIPRKFEKSNKLQRRSKVWPQTQSPIVPLPNIIQPQSKVVKKKPIPRKVQQSATQNPYGFFSETTRWPERMRLPSPEPLQQAKPKPKRTRIKRHDSDSVYVPGKEEDSSDNSVSPPTKEEMKQIIKEIAEKPEKKPKKPKEIKFRTANDGSGVYKPPETTDEDDEARTAEIHRFREKIHKEAAELTGAETAKEEAKKAKKRRSITTKKDAKRSPENSRQPQHLPTLIKVEPNPDPDPDPARESDDSDIDPVDLVNVRKIIVESHTLRSPILDEKSPSEHEVTQKPQSKRPEEETLEKEMPTRQGRAKKVVVEAKAGEVVKKMLRPRGRPRKEIPRGRPRKPLEEKAYVPGKKVQ